MSEAKRNLQKEQFNSANIRYALQDVRKYVQNLEDVVVKKSLYV